MELRLLLLPLHEETAAGQQNGIQH
jgi:hypothetical protein